MTKRQSGKEQSLPAVKDEDEASQFVDSNQVATGTKPREFWPHHTDFVLSCVGYAVGFGSIWRFPYLCYKNGGGAFLIPYIICMVVCGVPLFYMELAIAQFSGASPLALWEIFPLLKGVGWGMIVISGLVCIYYNIILTWVIYYLARSFAARVPWSTCSNWWNTCNCTETEALYFGNFTDANATDGREFAWPGNTRCNLTGPIAVNLSQTASDEFWRYNALQQSSGITDLGGIHWGLFFSLAFAWLIIFACVFKGVKSVGKVVYFTATSPYVFLFILLVRNAMLPGSWRGVKFYIKPVWSKLANLDIWHEAALQVFFSLGPAWGGLITMASFNKFKNNCYRDSIIVPAINCLTSIFGGFVIFSVIGFMAQQTNKEVEDVVAKGPGLVFVVYPEAIAQMPLAPLWAVLFFLMLITIGVDSQFGMFETMTSSFIDEFPNQLRKYKTPFVAAMCLLEFLLGLPLVTRGGIYLFTIFDWFIGTFALCIIALLEIIAIFYIYGIRRFLNDIESMLGHRPGYFWVAMWCCVTPLALVLILVSIAVNFTNPVLENYKFPPGSLVFGWLLGSISVAVIPIVAAYRIYKVGKGSFLERVRFLMKPTPNWGPQQSCVSTGPEAVKMLPA
ncbi:hypothetical protein BOX15_Mlig029317g3 [Macrostomum lignano]|uniref:Transporter n=1 Tax=Macrostomum lignano TaxID=282301 RepID=A0A267GI99_9PLAT|nr:hypothetical protein BOX15_Mlig029317g3 [Macrostomum lignano]